MTAPAVTLGSAESVVMQGIPARAPGMTREDWRTIRYAMRTRSQTLTHRGRVGRCGMPLATRPPALADHDLFDFPVNPILADVECYRRGRRAEFHGLQSCGSPWECPICAEKLGVENGRALNVAAAVVRARGGGTYTATLTVRHGATMELAPLVRALTLAWRKVQAGEPWRRRVARHAILGTVRAPEITHGANGFHPHLHIGLYTSRALAKEELAEFEAWLSERWRRILIRQGQPENIIPSFERGVRIRKLHKDDYLAKFGLGGELAKGVVKRAGVENRTPWQLLFDLTTGAGGTRDLWVWREYAAAMFRQKPLTWSRGLRRALDLETALELELARTRAEAEAEDGEREAELVLTVPGREWCTHVAGRALETDLMTALESGAPAERVRRWYARKIGRGPPLVGVCQKDPPAPLAFPGLRLA